MPTTEKILASSKVRKFMETHEGARQAVERAVEILHAEPDALVAVKKVLPALASGKISVFFSYKKKDEKAAMSVVKTLRDYSANKLEITYQAEFTEEIAGKLWRDKIREAVRPANWFMLLLPDPSDDWDWCLFETGLFVAQRCSADRLICLHHPHTRIPSQIRDYHAVKAIDTEVEGLLRLIFVNPDPVPGMPPLNPSLLDRIPTIAEEIVNAVRPPKEALDREVFEPWVELKIKDPDKLANKEDLDAALVLNANQRALDLFDFLLPPKTWGELRSEVEESGGDGRWRKELFHVFLRIACNRKFHPIQAVFMAKDGRMFRPVAHAVDRIGTKGPIDTYQITFTEDVGAVDTTRMPRDMSLLAELLRFVFRFRWEVLEEFSQPPMTEERVQRLDNTLRRIEKDWESRHIGSEEEIFAVFSPTHQKRFMEMSLAWREISNDEGTGKLDRAIQSGEKEKIPALLADFLPMNQEFLEVAADRFSEMVAGTREPKLAL